MRIATLVKTRIPALVLSAIVAGSPATSRLVGLHTPAIDAAVPSGQTGQGESRWNDLRFLAGPVLSRALITFATTSLIIQDRRILVQLEDGATIEIPATSVTSFGYLHDAFRESMFGAGTELMPLVPGPGLFGKTDVHLISIEFRDSNGKAAGVLLEAKKKDVYAAILRKLTQATGLSASVTAADRRRLPRDVPVTIVSHPPSGTLPGVLQWPVRWLSGHLKKVTSVAFSPDSSLLATGSEDGTVRLWQTDTGLPVGPAINTQSKSSVNTQTKPVGGVAFSADGRTLAAWGYNGEYGIRTWDVARRVQIAHVAVGLKGFIHVVPSSDLRFAAVSGRESTWTNTILRLIDLQKPTPVAEPLLRVPKGMEYQTSFHVAFSPDGALLYVWVWGPTPPSELHVWDAETREPLRRIQSIVRPFDWTLLRDGHFLVSDQSGSLFVVDANGAVLASFQREPQYWRGRHSISADGQIVAKVNWPQAVVLLDGKTLERIGMPLVGQRGSIDALAFDPSGTLLATDSAGQLVVWDVQTQQPIGQCFTGPPERFGYGVGFYFPTIEFAPHGRAVATIHTGSNLVALCPVDASAVPVRR
jgi:hypothetical protein